MRPFPICAVYIYECQQKEVKMTNQLQITETFYKHLYNFIKKRISEPKDVEDILHNALYKAQRNINTIKDNTKLSSWLFQIVRRAIIDFYRAKQIPVDLDDSVICNRPDPNPNQNKAIGNCLQDLIKQLPEKYRSALELTELKGISQVALSKQLVRHLRKFGALSRNLKYYFLV